MPNQGTPPKPARLRLLQGARRSEVNQREPVARTGEIVAPDYLSEPVRAIFDFVVGELQHMGIASPGDVDAIVAYSEAVQRHREASALLARSSLLIKGQKDNLVRNPVIQIQRDAAHLIRQYAQEFGLTPSARARIDTERAASDTDNPFSASGT